MNPTLILLISCGVVFAFLPLLFRSNAVAIFLTLCAGSIVSKLVAQDATQIVNSIVNFNVPMLSIVQIFLIVIAPVVLLLGLRKSITTPGIIWQLIPALAAAVLAVMFISASLPYEIQKQVEESQMYGLVKPYFGLAAAAGLLASVLHLWAHKPKHLGKHSKKHKK